MSLASLNGLFCHFLFSDVTTHRLVLNHISFIVKNCPVTPALPPYRSIRYNDPVVNGSDGFFRSQGGKKSGNIFTVIGINSWTELMVEEIFTRDTEVPAISIIDKDMGSVRQEAADELGLVVNNIPVSLLCLFIFGDISAHRLVINHISFVVKNCPVTPALPPHSSIRHNDPVVNIPDRFLRS